MLGKSLIVLLAFECLAYGDSRIFFNFYHAGGIERFHFINFHTIFNHPNFNRNGETVAFHYSSEQTLNTPQVNDVIQSYRQNGRFNFIVIDYDDSSVITAGNANDLAEGIMQAFVNLFNNGYNSGNTNFLGFGLGGQILARASRRVQASTSRRHIIGRLTGLDPASLGPINSITVGRLSSADAQFVESIHTEGSQRGDLESVGHVSYFVNGGVEQPMCNQVSPIARWDCSHVFVLTIWSESVRSPNPTFPALFCQTWELFLSGACNGNQVVNMGRATEFNLRGPHFLRTFNTPPFSSDNPWPSL